MSAVHPPPQLPEPLATYLKTYFDVELFWHSFHELIQSALSADPRTAEVFKQQFANAIVHGGITPEQYRALTNQSFKTEQEVRMWLRRLWEEIYGDEPIPGDE